jgi:hypothetical protein
LIPIIDPLLGAPKMRPCDRSNRLLGGVQDGATRRDRQICGDKALRRIKIALFRFVDDPKIASAFSLIFRRSSETS